MAELPEREQAYPTFDTLYTLAKKLEAGQPVHTHRYAPSSDAYREKHSCYPVPAGRVAALEEEGVASTDPVPGEDSESEVEAVDDLNVRTTTAEGGRRSTKGLQTISSRTPCPTCVYAP